MPLWKFLDYFLHLFVNVIRHRWLRRCWCSPASGWSRWQGELLSGSSLASGSWEQLGAGSRQLGAAGRGETSWNSHTVYTLYTCPPTLAWIMITTQEHNINNWIWLRSKARKSFCACKIWKGKENKYVSFNLHQRPQGNVVAYIMSNKVQSYNDDSLKRDKTKSLDWLIVTSYLKIRTQFNGIKKSDGLKKILFSSVILNLHMSTYVKSSPWSNTT